MSDILVLTELAGNKPERYKAESRLRFTWPTYISLKNNIFSGKIKVSFKNYNKTYEELKNAIVSAEVAAAENQARANVTQNDNPQFQIEEQKRLASIKEDEMVAKIVSVGVAKRRFASLSLAVHKLSGNFGTLGKNYGVNVKPKSLPRALSVPKLFSKVYTQILRNVDLYKLSDKVDAIDPSLVGTQLENGQTHSNVPSWRRLFENSTPKKTTDVTVAMNSQPLSKDSDEENALDIASLQSGVSTADLSHRNLLAQINDELEDLRKLRSSPNGFTSPFDSGLEEREDNLLSMLVSISGIKKKLKNKNANEKHNTEFQNLIEDIVGYSEPLSTDEYQKKAAEMEDYYLNPEVEKTIEDLRLKDILFSFNNPEAYNRVMEAERKDNERIAQKAIALDVIGNENEELDDDVLDTIVTIGSMEQAKQLKDRIEENKKIAAGSMEQAQMLIDQDERNFVIDQSKTQAQIFVDQDERKYVVDNAKEQAQMLADQDEKNYLSVGAKEQAQMLADQDEKNYLSVGAKEQAQIFADQDERSYLSVGAIEQAKMLKTLNDFMKKQAEMEEEAKKDTQLVVDGSLEQAQNLFQSSLERSKSETDTEIIDIADNQSSLMEDLISQMAYRNVIDDEIISGAPETARNIIAAEDRQIAERGAVETAGNIIAAEDRQIAERGAVETAGNIIAAGDRQIAERGAVETASNIIAAEDRQIAESGSLSTAANIINSEDYRIAVHGAPETAGNIIAAEDRQMVEQYAPDQAKSLYDAYIKSLKSEKKGIDLSHLNCVTLDTEDRYCSFIFPSRPLILRATQKKNLDLRLSSDKKSSTEDIKKALTTLREQLNDEEFDFLRYDENVVGRTKAA